MNKTGVITKLCFFLAIGALFLLQSCGGNKAVDGGGDLIGVQGREGWTMSVPYE